MAKVIVSKEGFKRLKKTFSELQNKAVKAGVLSSAGGDLAQIAQYNEFGTETIPERSFIRSTLQENSAKYGKALERGMHELINESASPDAVLGLIGLVVATDIQRKITTLEEPPNSPGTIEAKGSDKPLIDTGRLRQSISFNVVGTK